MKIITAYLGTCSTCGAPVIRTVDDRMFVGLCGEKLDQIRIEGHCGMPGHSLYAGIVTIEEFKAAPHGAII